MIDSKIGYSASNKKILTRLANKCERLSREYTKLRDRSCVCGCGKTTGLDWAHGISRQRELTKYHKLNTFRMNHECHLEMDHSGEQEKFMIKRLEQQGYYELKREAYMPFKPTVEWYQLQIVQLNTLIAEVQHDKY